MQHTDVQLYCAHHGITWKFIPPRAAWWGGWWEHMIGSVKRCLRKVLGRSQVDEESLNTTLISIEAAINSRPITQGESDTALTPAHLLNGGKLVTIPCGPEPATRKDLAKEFRLRKKVLSWWEHMIGSVKRCLRKVLGRSQVDEESLNTTLISIEAAINSRPITQGESDTALTPAHLLNGGKLVTIPCGPEPATRKDLAKEFRLRQKVNDDIWRRWKTEYLLLLRQYHEVKGYPSQRKPRIGEVVLLQEDSKPRHLWKRAVVEEVWHGRDCKIRCIILRQPDGMKICRPVQLVIPLEMDQGGEDVGE
ncbi:uncharacterized protein LOC126233618 [Schistocerca nitens]|uniref:uncharacterized protein LOC126233618 n=1 Tax=Schistocerca nitens TaxID=7011 RepID=UPI00211746A6|nr:uncharacterized protein LOC126233618 [Schistocerca nitens]